MVAILGIWDYIIIVFMLVISASIGMYFRFTGGRQKTTQEFFMAGKNMASLPAAFSLMASFMSAVTMMGLPAEVYMYGTQMYTKLFAYFISGITAAYVYLPVFYDMKVTTAYEYLEKRFGKILRTIASLMFSLQMIFYMGVIFYAPCAALNAVTGLSTWGTVIILALICTFYSSMGGLKAVLWTDVFQALLMFTTLFAFIIQGTIYLGGIKNTFEIANAGGRIQLLNAEFNLEERYTIWNTIISGFLSVLSLFGANQTEIQRMLSVRSLRKARWALLFSIVLIVSFNICCFYIGIIVYSMFSECDPMLRPSNGTLSSPNQLVPYAMVTLFEHMPGLSGLCIAGIFSASLSSVSSAVNSLATVTVEDFIRPQCTCCKMSDSWMSFLAKLVAVGYGGLCLLMSLTIGKFRGIYEAASILVNMISGPVLGIFSLGILTTTANEGGTLVGLVTGFTLNAWMAFGAFHSKAKIPPLPRSIDSCPETNLFGNNTATTTDQILRLSNAYRNYTRGAVNKDAFPLYRISYCWYNVISFSTVMIVGYTISYAINFLCGNMKPVQPELITPVLRKWHFPESDKNNLEMRIRKYRVQNISFEENITWNQSQE